MTVHSTVAAGGLSGALVGIGISIAESFGAKIDAGLAVDLSTVVAVAIGWLCPAFDMSTPVQK